MSQSLCLIHVNDAKTVDTVDAIKDALIALRAPLRFHRNKLCWLVDGKHLTLTTKRLEYEISRLGIRFERKNARGNWESVGAPKSALKMFLALAEGGQWFVDEWNGPDVE
jgi:hypothetical protein